MSMPDPTDMMWYSIFAGMIVGIGYAIYFLLFQKEHPRDRHPWDKLGD